MRFRCRDARDRCQAGGQRSTDSGTDFAASDPGSTPVASRRRPFWDDLPRLGHDIQRFRRRRRGSGPQVRRVCPELPMVCLQLPIESSQRDRLRRRSRRTGTDVFHIGAVKRGRDDACIVSGRGVGVWVSRARRSGRGVDVPRHDHGALKDGDEGPAATYAAAGPGRGISGRSHGVGPRSYHDRSWSHRGVSRRYGVPGPCDDGWAPCSRARVRTLDVSGRPYGVRGFCYDVRKPR